MNPYLSHTHRNASWQQQFLPLAHLGLLDPLSGASRGALYLFQARRDAYFLFSTEQSAPLNRWPYTRPEDLVAVLNQFNVAGREYAKSRAVSLVRGDGPPPDKGFWYLAYAGAWTALGLPPDPYSFTQAVPPELVVELGRALKHEALRHQTCTTLDSAFGSLERALGGALSEESSQWCAAALRLAAVSVQDGVAGVAGVLDARALEAHHPCPFAQAVAPLLSDELWDDVHEALFYAEYSQGTPLWLGCADLLAATFDLALLDVPAPHGRWLRKRLAMLLVS